MNLLPGSSRRTRAIFKHMGVDYRHAVIDAAYYTVERTTEERNACYLSEAVPLAEDAIRRCLDTAGCMPNDIDDLIVVSCTGIDTPGLDLRLAGRLGMRPALRRTSILGMGCYAAFPGLLRATEAVIARPGSTALVLAVELCSLHFQMDESLENIVSTALFADGAAAALVTSRTPARYPRPAPRVLDALTFCDYTTFDHMAFHLTNFGFQMRLSAYVPDLLAAKIEDFVDTLLERNHLSRASIRWWGVHPGSGKILDHVQERLGLSDAQLAPSRAVLRDYGNMSSPTILFVLDAIHREQQPAQGDFGVLMAFGPGLTMESLLVQW